MAKKRKATTKRKTKGNSGPLLPAKVRINPRTGKVQVFVSPKVAAQVKRRGNPASYGYRIEVGSGGKSKVVKNLVPVAGKTYATKSEADRVAKKDNVRIKKYFPHAY